MIRLSEDKIHLSQLVCQAKESIESEVLEMLKFRLESLLETLRDTIVGRDRNDRSLSGLYRYGYTVRKSVESPWGALRDVRIPRIRGPNGEVRMFESNERRLSMFCDSIVFGYGDGMSLRSLSIWLKGVGLPTASADSLRDVINDAAQELSDRRMSPIDSSRYAALVLDGIWAKRRGGKRQALLVAVGVLFDGSFEVLDWEGCPSESTEGYELLLNRLYERGLDEVGLIVADECPGLWRAVETVYPWAQKQVCLYHLQKGLEGELKDRSWQNRRRFRRDYWHIFDALDREEAQQLFEKFAETWRRREPGMVKAFKSRYESIFNYYQYPSFWRHRLRTTNLAEGFFKHLRRFLRRFPGFKDDKNIETILATYLLSQEKKRKLGRTTPYQLQLCFNRIT